MREDILKKLGEIEGCSDHRLIEETRDNVMAMIMGLAVTKAKPKPDRVNYVAYNFDTNTYNCDTYFGQDVRNWKKIYRYKLEAAKGIFDKENPKWELVEIRSMCTTHRLEGEYGIYPEAPKFIYSRESPKRSKRNVYSVCQIVARDRETGQLIESKCVLRNGYYDDLPYCTDTGFEFCICRIGISSDFRNALVAALESAASQKR